MREELLKIAADRATKESRKALAANDIDKVYRIAETMRGERPRLLKRLGTGSDATAFLTHGGDWAGPTVAKVITDRDAKSLLDETLREPMQLRRILGDDFAEVRMPRRVAGLPRAPAGSVKMTDRVGGYLQEWVPHDAEIAGSRSRRSGTPRDFGKTFDALVKKRDLAEQAMYDAEEAGKDVTLSRKKYFAWKKAVQDDTAFRASKSAANPTRGTTWAKAVAESPAAKDNKVWDVNEHAGNVRKTHDGNYKVIDARLGDGPRARGARGVINADAPVQAPRDKRGVEWLKKTKQYYLDDPDLRQAWLPEMFSSMHAESAPQLNKMQRRRKEINVLKAKLPPSVVKLPTATHASRPLSALGIGKTPPAAPTSPSPRMQEKLQNMYDVSLGKKPAPRTFTDHLRPTLTESLGAGALGLGGLAAGAEGLSIHNAAKARSHKLKMLAAAGLGAAGLGVLAHRLWKNKQAA